MTAWTRERPQEIGWYWRRDTERSAFYPVEIVWANYRGPLELWMRCEGEMRPLENVTLEGGEWAGPLEVPPNPPAE